MALTPPSTPVGRPVEVLAAFLHLGLTSFGGPVAHVGYFRREFVERRDWLSDADFAQLVAYTHLLPGPSSSQLGLCIGLLRAGWIGALAAFVGFTLPSALLLLALALALPAIPTGIAHPVIAGLKLVAVPVVAHAVVTMARSLCAGFRPAAIAAAAACSAVLLNGAPGQLAAGAVGVLGGLLLLPPAAPPRVHLPSAPFRRASGAWCLATCAALLVLLPFAARVGGWAAVAAAFFQSGSLVFGGGHVVLPLLREAVVTPGWVDPAEFLAGYGAAQAMPGPLFSFAAFLGARLGGGAGGVTGAAVALVSLFLPGLLLAAGALPWWHDLARHPRAHRVLQGVNAAVVGLLAATLLNPVASSAIHDSVDVIIAFAGFLLLLTGRVSPLFLVPVCIASAALLP
jgi:chromate transporter